MLSHELGYGTIELQGLARAAGCGVLIKGEAALERAIAALLRRVRRRSAGCIVKLPPARQVRVRVEAGGLKPVPPARAPPAPRRRSQERAAQWQTREVTGFRQQGFSSSRLSLPCVEGRTSEPESSG